LKKHRSFTNLTERCWCWSF